MSSDVQLAMVGQRHGSAHDALCFGLIPYRNKRIVVHGLNGQLLEFDDLPHARFKRT